MDKKLVAKELIKIAKSIMAVNIGSVSSGTMKPDDLIPSFISELQYQKGITPEHKKLVKEIEDRMEDEQYYDSEDAGYDLEALFDALNEYAPSYFYFGANEGDGADYGYWLSSDFEAEFDGLKVEDTSEVPDNYNGEVLHINDHGNMTLYSASNGNLKEIWAIV